MSNGQLAPRTRPNSMGRAGTVVGRNARCLTVLAFSAAASLGGCKSSGLSSRRPDSAIGTGGASQTGGATGLPSGSGGIGGGLDASPTVASGGVAGGGLDGSALVGGAGGLFPDGGDAPTIGGSGGGGGVATTTRITGSGGNVGGDGGGAGWVEGGESGGGGFTWGGGGNGGSGGNPWTDTNCYMRCGQGNAIYFGGGGQGGVAGGGGGGGGSSGDASSGTGIDGAANECAIALPIECGTSRNDSTLVQGRADTWRAYGSTERLESGRETLYVFAAPAACAVVAQLENLTTDLDLLLLTECSPVSNPQAASTPLDLQTVETIRFTATAGQTYYLVVDGYNGAAGTYTLQIDCTCPG